MSGQKLHRPRPGYWSWAMVATLVLAACPSWSLAAAVMEGRIPDSWTAAGVRQVWQAVIPVRHVDKIRAWHLVDAYLFAIGSDGVVRAFAADTGTRLWTQPMAEPLASLFPPTFYQDGDVRAMVFTVRDRAIFIDPVTGSQLRRPHRLDSGETELRPVGPVHLWAGPIGPVVATGDYVFQAAPRKRIRQYSISRDVQTYQVGIDANIVLPPLCIPDKALLVLADYNGTVAATDISTRETVFAAEVNARPLGWLAADEHALYVVTSGPRLHVLDLSHGHERLEGYSRGFLLPALPVEGPVVTKESIYVALEGNKLQRVGKELKWPNWTATGVRRLLAEWPGRVALLAEDGKIRFVRPETGETLTAIEPPIPGLDGLSNPLNDAIFLTSARGEARCLRPVDVPPLKEADFRPVTVRPASAPAGETRVVADTQAKPETTEEE
ncbi:MAG: outer membrane protein assembly factor BamB family protein, partial [Phycisphaerae bacterium]